MLLAEIRQLLSEPHALPIVLIALPRWAALTAARERAAEQETRLPEPYADTLRDSDKDKVFGRMLWLDVPEHPNGGVHILFHRQFQAGIITGWRYRHGLLWPRSFREGSAPLLPMRSDQQFWGQNPTLVQLHLGKLNQAAYKLARKRPDAMIPSPTLVAMIQKSQDDAARIGVVRIGMGEDREPFDWLLSNCKVLGDEKFEDHILITIQHPDLPVAPDIEKPPAYEFACAKHDDGQVSVKFAPVENS